MRFLPTDEQLAFGEAIDDIVESHGAAAIARAWGQGDTRPGAKLWSQFAQTGLMAMSLSEEEGGLGASAVDIITVFERLGFHGIPGPLLESIVLLPPLLTPEQRQKLATGEMIATAAVENYTPYGVDADFANAAFHITDGSIASANVGEKLSSIDPTRALFHLTASKEKVPLDPDLLATALDTTTLAAAAALLGAGEQLLAQSVDYAKVREQFGRKIGEYQALKHQLADVRIALSFARPLIQGAALSVGGPDGPRDVSAAKVQASKAASLAARVGLQVHAGIGYTEEHDLSIWLRRVPALTHIWGTVDYHRSRVASAITKGAAS